MTKLLHYWIVRTKQYEEINTLYQFQTWISLIFLQSRVHVKELKEIARQLDLEEKGNKRSLILRICHFLETGEKLTSPRFPAESCAQKGKAYSPSKNGLMLKGAYKNDLQNRLFFKSLIGPHFHFTAFGIDWLDDRWLQGDPPTYREFAHMWKEEYERRKRSPASPKEEWAYINFVQKFIIDNPDASQQAIHQSWQAEREKHKAEALQFIML